MAKKVLKAAKTDSTEVPISFVNGIKAFATGGPTTAFSDINSFKSRLQKSYYRHRCERVTIEAGKQELMMLAGGLLCWRDMSGLRYLNPDARRTHVSPKRYARLSDVAVYQLLGILRIPRSYALRIPHSLLIASINEIINSNPGLTINLRMCGNEAAISISTRYTGYSLSQLINQISRESSFQFHFASVAGARSSCFVLTDKDGDGKSWRGAEIFCDESLLSPPTICPALFTAESGHAIFSSHGASFSEDWTEEPFSEMLAKVDGAARDAQTTYAGMGEREVSKDDVVWLTGELKKKMRVEHDFGKVDNFLSLYKAANAAMSGADTLHTKRIRCEVNALIIARSALV